MTRSPPPPISPSPPLARCRARAGALSRYNERVASLKSIRTWLATTLVGASILTAGVIALYIVPTVDRQYR